MKLGFHPLPLTFLHAGREGRKEAERKWESWRGSEPAPQVVSAQETLREEELDNHPHWVEAHFPEGKRLG